MNHALLTLALYNPVAIAKLGNNAAGPGFVTTYGLHLIGRWDLSDSDTPSSPKVAIVNESFARHFYGNLNVIGRSFALRGQPKVPISIVGLIADAHDRGPKSPAERVAYTAFDQDDNRWAAIAVRTDAPSQTAIGEIKSAAHAVDARVPCITFEL